MSKSPTAKAKYAQRLASQKAHKEAKRVQQFERDKCTGCGAKHGERHRTGCTWAEEFRRLNEVRLGIPAAMFDGGTGVTATLAALLTGRRHAR